jgi:hypothetical protein
MYDGDTTAAPDPFAHHVPTGMDAEVGHVDCMHKNVCVCVQILGSDGRVHVQQNYGRQTNYNGWWKGVYRTTSQVYPKQLQ